MTAYAEITVAPTAAWQTEVFADPDDGPPADQAVTRHVQPAVAFLSARDGGVMILPLDAV